MRYKSIIFREIKVETTYEHKFTLMDKIKELLKNPLSGFAKIVDFIDVDVVKINFENRWGLVGASNTTPLLITISESKDMKLAKVYEEALNRLIKTSKGHIW